jgi:hypothetical protein
MRATFAAFAAAAVLCLAGTAAFAGKQDFTLVNNTGYQIDKVYVSSVGAKSWEDDILGRDTLDDGEQVAISFEKGERGCHYDLKVVYQDKDEAEWHDVDLCEISTVHIHWDKTAGTTTATAD